MLDSLGNLGNGSEMENVLLCKWICWNYGIFWEKRNRIDKALAFDTFFRHKLRRDSAILAPVSLTAAVDKWITRQLLLTVRYHAWVRQYNM
jgi:hypothetical protein